MTLLSARGKFLFLVFTALKNMFEELAFFSSTQRVTLYRFRAPESVSNRHGNSIKCIRANVVLNVGPRPAAMYKST
jgi:hypothetical protein